MILHIVGATAVVALTVWFHLGLSAPVTEPAAQASPDGGSDAQPAGAALPASP